MTTEELAKRRAWAAVHFKQPNLTEAELDSGVFMPSENFSDGWDRGVEWALRTECWKDVVGYEGLYQVSNFGRVRSVDKAVLTNNINHASICRKRKGRILGQYTDSCGYSIIQLWKDGNPQTQGVHRLVAKAFIPNPNNLSQVNHIDGNKQNNQVDNLEWCTASDNVRHAYENGLNHGITGLGTRIGVTYPDGQYKEFNSQLEAAKILNVNPKTVHSAIIGDKTSVKLKGFKIKLIRARTQPNRESFLKYGIEENNIDHNP